MKKHLAIGLFISLMLTACSFTMRGTVTDITTGSAINSAQIEVKVSADQTRTASTNDQGKYRIKKDDKEQEMTFRADGFDPFATSLKNTKSKDIYLIPSPETTAARLFQSMQDRNYEVAYNLLHPNYQGLFSLDEFTRINASFADYLANVKDFKIQDVKDLTTFEDIKVTKTYNDVKQVDALLTFDDAGTIQSIWPVYLQKMKDQNDKTFYHWLYSTTSNR
jgi:hypothetical protein